MAVGIAGLLRSRDDGLFTDREAHLLVVGTIRLGYGSLHHRHWFWLSGRLDLGRLRRDRLLLLLALLCCPLVRFPFRLVRLLFPLFLNWALHLLIRGEVRPGLLSQLELVCFGTLIIVFLVVEPRGLARLWQITKEKLRLWPFPH